MRILVTGASGRVGANLARTLVERGHQVRAFIFPGDASRLRKLDADDVEVVVGDLREMDDAARAVHGVDAIYHLAAAMLGPFDNTSYFDVNARGTFNIVEAARLHAPNLRRFVYASTDAVYGAHRDDAPLEVGRENQDVQPTGMYAFGKWVGERLCLAYHRQYGFPAVAFRFNWVIGAGEILDPNYVQVVWLDRVLERWRAQRETNPDAAAVLAVLEPLRTRPDTLLASRSASGRPERKHFVDVRDLLQGLLLGLERDDAIGDVFNLPGPEVVDFTRLVPYAAERLGLPYVEAQLPVPFLYKETSYEKAARVLGYRPRHDMRSMVDLALAMRRGEDVGLIPTGVPYGAADASPR